MGGFLPCCTTDVVRVVQPQSSYTCKSSLSCAGDGRSWTKTFRREERIRVQLAVHQLHTSLGASARLCRITKRAVCGSAFWYQWLFVMRISYGMTRAWRDVGSSRAGRDSLEADPQSSKEQRLRTCPIRTLSERKRLLPLRGRGVQRAVDASSQALRDGVSSMCLRAMKRRVRYCAQVLCAYGKDPKSTLRQLLYPLVQVISETASSTCTLRAVLAPNLDRSRHIALPFRSVRSRLCLHVGPSGSHDLALRLPPADLPSRPPLNRIFTRKSIQRLWIDVRPWRAVWLRRVARAGLPWHRAAAAQHPLRAAALPVRAHAHAALLRARHLRAGAARRAFCDGGLPGRLTTRPSPTTSALELASCRPCTGSCKRVLLYSQWTLLIVA
eukprot:6209297-Pleurochrysis_carterae.AAC.1